ncbi:hypothetical protein Tco_1352686 [Tanacetum coccineum]
MHLFASRGGSHPIYTLSLPHPHTLEPTRLSILFAVTKVRIFPTFTCSFSFWFFFGISGSEPGEMAPESSKAMVLPKFDMHIYTSELTSLELKMAVEEYCIPLDLHPRLPPPGMTMNKLPPKYIGLYTEQLEQGGLRIPFSSFFLAVIKHFGVHVSQLVPMGVNRGWKKMLFLLDRRAIPDAMPWRHDDTDLHDDLPAKYNEDDVSRLSEDLGVKEVNNRYVPNWGLRNDLRVCTFRACRELVSHLATLAEDEFLGNLSNVEVVSRAYQTLGQSVLAQGELLKRHEQLNHDYVDLANRNDAILVELDRLKVNLQRENEDNAGLTHQLSLVDNAHSECPSREKELLDMVKDLERERDEWRKTASGQVEKIRGLEEKVGGLEREKLALSDEVVEAKIDSKTLVREFNPTVIKRLHMSVEYRQSLAALVGSCYTAGWLGGLSLGRTEEQIAQILFESQDLDIEGSKTWEAKHRELFTKSYPYVQKIADSYDLPMSELLKVVPDVPSADEGTTSSPPKDTSDAQFVTTT